LEKLNFLITGFLRSEGFIESLDDIALMRVCDEENVADVRLMRPKKQPTGKRILTSGCGGGVTFDSGDGVVAVTSDLRVAPAQLLAHMKAMLLPSDNRHGERGGLHVSALADEKQLLVIARDVGRHNTLDKIWGECLFREIDTRGKVLLTTGRLSSEMMIKAAKMGVPITVSLNSPTSRAVQLARELGITVVGYARGGRLSVYAHPERLGVTDPAAR
ncbi:MAG TPA: formate dehydrogenase accessory sulfurtransferase FdhD, partial [Chloroflexota bacterium]|nr:formate dehydrogenase accessory sulfurtransferase FdhD [Chloroflexota bacterium]